MFVDPDDDQEDLIPEDTTVGTHLRCYCGETRLESTQRGTPPKCIKCSECHSTLAPSKDKCEQSIPHDWDKDGNVKTCVRCLREEVIETKADKG